MKPNMISRHVGHFLRRIRKEKNMTGKELAKLINISQQQISRYETGTSAISLEQLNEILIVLDKRWIEVFFYIESFSGKIRNDKSNLNHLWGENNIKDFD